MVRPWAPSGARRAWTKGAAAFAISSRRSGSRTASQCDFRRIDDREEYLTAEAAPERISVPPKFSAHPVTLGACHGSHVYDPARSRRVTDGRARVADREVRGTAAPSAGRRLSHAWLAERRRRRCPRSLAPAQWIGLQRNRRSRRVADDRRCPHLPEHAPFAQDAERSSR